jgi:hypothetical protein
VRYDGVQTKVNSIAWRHGLDRMVEEGRFDRVFEKLDRERTLIEMMLPYEDADGREQALRIWRTAQDAFFEDVDEDMLVKAEDGKWRREVGKKYKLGPRSKEIIKRRDERMRRGDEQTCSRSTLDSGVEGTLRWPNVEEVVNLELVNWEEQLEAERRN